MTIPKSTRFPSALRFLLLTTFLYYAPAAQPITKTVDVAVIGGGLSGLSAAKDLAAANRTFAILEARDRVGGRVLSANISGNKVQELGADYVGPTQDRVLALAAELGLPTYKTYIVGNSTFFRNGTVHHYKDQLGGIPPVGLDSLVELALFMNELNALASTVDLDAPWRTPNATALDSMTFQTYVESRVHTPDSRVLLDVAIPAILSTELKEPSLLYVLWYIAAAGNESGPGTINRLIGIDGAAQDSRLRGGTQLLATRLAENLGWENIILSAPVRSVKLENNSRYTVSSENVTISARHVVVAMSPPLVNRIIFDPPLPAGRAQLNQRMPIGSLGKAIAIFERPWWRGQGLNAAGVSDTGAIRVTYDNTPADASFGALMGFIEADEMRKLDSVSEEEVKQQVQRSLTNLFGPLVKTATEILVQRWDLEEFSRGGPAAYMPPGVLTQYGSFLRAPVGRIHFAGTETSIRWIGYMDGAISSGERVAREIMESSY
jgi:monoamine oxidase